MALHDLHAGRLRQPSCLGWLKHHDQVDVRVEFAARPVGRGGVVCLLDFLTHEIAPEVRVVSVTTGIGMTTSHGLARAVVRSLVSMS